MPYDTRRSPAPWQELDAEDDTRVNGVPCPGCSGVGAIQHGSRNPELTTDCPTCNATGEVAAA